MSYSISYMYEIVDRFSAPLEKIRRAAVRSSTEIIKQTDRIAASLSGVSSAANRTKMVVDRLSSLKASLAQTTLEAERMRRAMEKQIKIPSIPAIRDGAIGGRAGGARTGGRAGGGDFLQSAAGFAFPALALNQMFQASAGLEASLSNVARLTDLDPAGLAAFKKQAEGTAKFLGISTQSALDLAAGGSQAGVATADLERFTKLSGMTAVAAGFGFAEAGELIGSIKSQLGLTMPEMEKLADQVNYISDKTVTSPEKMYNVLTRASGALRGYSVETQTALAGFFSNVEPMPEVAATALNKVLQVLTKQSGKLGEISRKDGAAGLKMYLEGMAKVYDKDAAKAKSMMEKAFGGEYLDTMEKLLKRHMELPKLLGLAGSEEAVGSQIKEFEMRQKTMQAKMEKFAARWEDIKAKIFGTDIGGGFLDFLNEALLKLGEFIDKNPEISKFIVVMLGLATAAGAVALAFTLLSGPVGLVVGAAMLIGGALAYIWDKSEPLRRSVGGLADEFAELFGFGDSDWGWLEKFGLFLADRIGKGLSLAIDGFRGLIQVIALAARALSALASGDLAGVGKAWDEYQANIAEINKSILKTLNDERVAKIAATTNAPYVPKPQEVPGIRDSDIPYLESEVDLAAADAAKRQEFQRSQIDVSVKAEQGTKVAVSSTKLATGTNVRVGQ